MLAGLQIPVSDRPVKQGVPRDRGGLADVAEPPGRVVGRLLARRKPRRLGDLSGQAWKRTAKRTFDQYRADGLTNLVAALTYRSVLPLFPGLIAFVALLALLGQYPQTFDAVLRIVGGIGPQSTVQASHARSAGTFGPGQPRQYQPIIGIGSTPASRQKLRY